MGGVCMGNSIVVAQSIEQAGLVANVAAARHVFGDYCVRKSSNSLRAQLADLQTFVDYLAAAGVEGPPAEALQAQPAAWQGVTHGLVRGFVAWLLGRGLALASVNRKLSTVKVYAGLAAQAGMMGGAELALIKSVQGYSAREFARVNEKRLAIRLSSKKEASTTLAPEQVKALKSQPDTPQGRRDAVMMCLLLDHGLRVGELAALAVTDVNLPAGELRFYRPKVDKVQTHRLTPDALAALRAYFVQGNAPALGPLLRGSNKAGLLTSSGMTERSITRRVGRLGEQIGIEKLSAHDLRHSWATRAIRKGTDPFALQQAGGWTSMQTVRKYVDESAIANDRVML
jgi:integrase